MNSAGNTTLRYIDKWSAPEVTGRCRSPRTRGMVGEHPLNIRTRESIANEGQNKRSINSKLEFLNFNKFI